MVLNPQECGLFQELDLTPIPDLVINGNKYQDYNLQLYIVKKEMVCELHNET